MQSARTTFKSTREGLDWKAYPMRLFQKARKWGIWDPTSFDFSQNWQALTPDEQYLFLQLTAQFVAGEESVTLDLLPLVQYMAEEGRLEDEIYLTSFLWEEAKHVEALFRFLDEVVGVPAHELEVFLTLAYRKHVMEEQPRAMSRLRTDRSHEALAEAAIAYNMITEGVLAETSYFAYYTVMDRRKMMPGMREMIQHIQRDKSRHIGYGVYILSRLIAEHGRSMGLHPDAHRGDAAHSPWGHQPDFRCLRLRAVRPDAGTLSRLCHGAVHQAGRTSGKGAGGETLGGR